MRGSDELGERERREHVDPVDALEHVERVAAERRLRARAEQAGVVDEQVDLLAGGLDERAAVPVVGDVARERDDLGDRAELAGGALEVGGAAGVEHERPAALGERAGEREAEASRCSGDDC